MSKQIKVSKGYYPLNIKKIEKKYDAKYLGDFEYPGTDNTGTDIIVATFYAYNPDISKSHSHYFGLYIKKSDIIPELEISISSNTPLYIINADKIANQILTGIKADNGEIVVSCYRHHYNESTDGSVFVDGGIDYIHTVKNPKRIPIIFDKDKLIKGINI